MMSRRPNKKDDKESSGRSSPEDDINKPGTSGKKGKNKKGQEVALYKGASSIFQGLWDGSASLFKGFNLGRPEEDPDIFEVSVKVSASLSFIGMSPIRTYPQLVAKLEQFADREGGTIKTKDLYTAVYIHCLPRMKRSPGDTKNRSFNHTMVDERFRIWLRYSKIPSNEKTYEWKNSVTSGLPRDVIKFVCSIEQIKNRVSRTFKAMYEERDDGMEDQSIPEFHKVAKYYNLSVSSHTPTDNYLIEMKDESDIPSEKISTLFK